MSSPIMPISGPRGHAGPKSSGIDRAGEFAAIMSSLETVEASRGGPPPEVLELMAAAGPIHDGLRRQGYELGFALAGPGEGVRIELRDSEGKLVRTLSNAEACELAAGRPLE
jgi:hypothetical protein